VNPASRNPRRAYTRAEVEAMLREIAFVLRMTQRVRRDIIAETQPAVLAESGTR
jgi:hypothetical protein